MKITTFSELDISSHYRLERGLKRQLRLRALISRPSIRRGILRILSDDVMFESMMAESWATFQEQMDGQEIGDGGLMDQILRFFDWVIENWDTIEKIIKAIIGLFAGFSTNAIAANADEDSEIERMLDDIEDAEKAS